MSSNFVFCVLFILPIGLVANDLILKSYLLDVVASVIFLELVVKLPQCL